MLESLSRRVRSASGRLSLAKNEVEDFGLPIDGFGDRANESVSGDDAEVASACFRCGRVIVGVS
jgi:hypothetical protein